MSEYDVQAQRFLERFNLCLTLQQEDGKCPNWNRKECAKGNHNHGNHYEVTIRRKRSKVITLAETGVCPNGHKGCLLARCYIDKGKPSKLVFDFWGSIRDAEEGEGPSAYDVLACIGSDVQTTEDPDELVEEMGPMPPSQALACVEFGKKLRAFFTKEEQDSVVEIR